MQHLLIIRPDVSRDSYHLPWRGIETGYSKSPSMTLLVSECVQNSFKAERLTNAAAPGQSKALTDATRTPTPDCIEDFSERTRPGA